MTDGHIDRTWIEKLEKEAVDDISNAEGLEALEQVRIKFLGRKGILTGALRSNGELPPEERPVVGGLINEVKGRINEQLESRISRLSGTIEDDEPYPGDPTLPGRRSLEGGRHILRRTINDIKEIFFRMGSRVRIRSWVI